MENPRMVADSEQFKRASHTRTVPRIGHAWVSYGLFPKYLDHRTKEQIGCATQNDIAELIDEEQQDKILEVIVLYIA